MIGELEDRLGVERSGGAPRSVEGETVSGRVGDGHKLLDACIASREFAGSAGRFEFGVEIQSLAQRLYCGRI